MPGNESATEESDIELLWGEVVAAAGVGRMDGEPIADASSRNAMADRSDMLGCLEERKELLFGSREGLVEERCESCLVLGRV